MLVLALAACSEDPSLRVRVDFERPPMHGIVVSVYESPSITCEQIEYGDLTETQLSALLVDEQSITGDMIEGTLDNLSRTEHKLIVARGYSQTGELLEAGCAEHDLVVENDSVTVNAHVIASVSAQIVEEMSMAMIPVPKDPLEIAVLVTDRDGIALQDRPVSWRMIGPSGSDETQSTNVRPTGDGTWQPEIPACTGPNGGVRIHPVTPNLVGGFAVSVRAAWSHQTQTQFSGITNTDFTVTELTIPDETKHPCAVGITRPDGVITKRLVCIDGANVLEFPVTTIDGKARLGTPLSGSLARPPVGLFALPNQVEPALRDVIAVDRDGNVTSVFGAPGSTPSTNCAECANQVVDAMLAPACGERDEAKIMMVVRTAGGDQVKSMPARGGLVLPVTVMTDPSNLTVNLNNAGCATAIGASGYEDRQLAVLDLITPAGSITRGFYDCNPSCRRVALPVAESAVAFTKTSPPYLIGAASDATGIVLATWGLVPDPDDPRTDRLVERAGRVASSGPPGRLAVGTYDEDNGPDMIWDLPSRTRAGATFELAYSSTAGVRLQALSLAIGVGVVDILSTDVTQDDHDDLIIVTRRIVGDQGGVIVIPTHAVAPPKSIPVTTCN